MLNIDTLLDEKKAVFDDYLDYYLGGFIPGSGISDAFAYSLKAGGKRIRPILTMLACEAFGGDRTYSLSAALSIEMIHTFSLIHDDLPALDNDDLRRGRPTCHIKFGESTAILAGDALIFQAISVICSSEYPLDVKMDICKMMAYVCGTDGLVQGEYQDVMAEGKDLSLEKIEDIYLKKTSRLFELCMYAGGRIVSKDKQKIQSLVDYGRYLGLAFQAIDDILDVTSSVDTLGKTSGKDLLQDKATVVKVLGVEKAREWARQATGSAIKSLACFEDTKTMHLKNLALRMFERVM